MLLHYLKIAVRNLLKYKTQSVISILGLAIGLACFALATLWVKYEQSYDAFHEDAERLYYVKADSSSIASNREFVLPYPLGKRLKDNHPEIEDYAVFNRVPNRLYTGNVRKEVNFISADSSFMNFMHIKIVAGNTHFMMKGSKEVAITEQMAEELYGNHSPLGKEVELDNEKRTIGAIVTGWGKHSHLHYDFMGDLNYPEMWDFHMFRILIKLREGVNPDELQQKMNANFPKEITDNVRENSKKAFNLVPVNKIHFEEGYFGASASSYYTGHISIHYIMYFAGTGLLIITCALVNYLTIFVNRIRVRQKEMALRKVNGASRLSLVALLATEIMVMLFFSMFLGMMITEIAFAPFSNYAHIEMTQLSMYLEAATCFTIIAIIVLLLMLVIVRPFLNQQVQQNLLSARREKWLRKGSVIVQLGVCLFFMVCTTLVNKQLNHLRNRDLGMVHHNIASASVWYEEDMNVWKEKIASLPMVEEVLPPLYNPLVAMGSYGSFLAGSWDNTQGGTDEGNVNLSLILAGKDFMDLYHIQQICGEPLTSETGVGRLYITESTAEAFGWTPEEAIGKKVYFHMSKGFYQTVEGVVKDCIYSSPSMPTPYTAFVNAVKQPSRSNGAVLFRFKEGTWNECRQAIEKMYEETCPDKWLRLYNEEEAFNQYLQSENTLMRLLEFVSLVCILISIFGIYSLVTMTCEQRRKEIAIRKVNGAHINTILQMFAKEYLTLLVVSSCVAFPIAYGIMKTWIQSYSRQAEIGILPFALIFFGIAIIIALSIGYRVWKAANENPADVVKSE